MARLTGNANSFTEISSVTATFGRVKSAEIFKSIAYNIPIGKVRSAVVVKNPNPIDSFSFDPNKISQFKVIGPTNPTPSINLANVAKLRAAQVLKNPSPNDAFLFDPNKISQFKVIGPTNPTPGINLADVAKLKAAQVLKASVPREDIYYDPYTIRQFKNVNNQIFYSPASDKLQNFDSVNWQLQYQPNVVVAGTLNNKTNTSYPVSQLLSTSRTASGSNQLISLSAGTYYGTFNSSRLSTAASTAFDFSGGTFTIEFWMNPLTSVVSAGNTCRILMFGTNGQANAYNVAINSDGSVSASIPLGGTTGLGTAPGVIGTNTWYHVAVVVSSGIGRIYINGELRSGPSTITLPTTGAIACNIGYDTVATVNFQYFGYMSNLRIVKGVAVYTGNFIPSGPLSRIQSARTNVVALSGTETSLLTFNSATVVDNSVNAFTFTPTGNIVTATVTSAYLQNPIANEYLLLTDTTTNYQALTPISSVTSSGGGGSQTITTGTYSAQFDGSSQYVLATGSQTPGITSENFTIECWFYLTGLGNYNGFRATLLNAAGNGSLNNFSDGGIWINIGGTGPTTATGVSIGSSGATNPGPTASATVSIPLNTWHHFAVSRSGTNFAFWFNGTKLTLDATVTNPSNNYAAGALSIGVTTHSNGYASYFPGYISNFRIVKGTPVYSPTGGNITVPTSPLTAVTGTYLLTLQNATIVDNSLNTFTLVGSSGVTVSSSVVPDLTTSTVITVGASSFTFSVPNSYITNLNSANAWSVQLWDPELMPQSKVKTNLNPINARERLYYATLVNTKYGQFIPFKEQAIGQPNNILSSTLRQSTYQNFATLNSPLAVNDKLEVFSSTDWYRRDNSNIILVGSANTKSNPNNVISTMTSNTRTASGSNSLITVTSNTYYGSFSGAQSLTTPANAAFSFGVGDFTIEAWVYPTATPAVNGMIFGFRSGTDTSPYLFWTSTNQIIFGGDLTNFITYSPGLTLNTWTHIAVTRLGTNLRLFLNGIQVSSVSNSTNFSDASTKYIGGINGASPYYFTGFISNLRVVKGTAVYTGLFTPSGPLSRIQPARNNVAALTGAETSLLTFQSATVIDNSIANAGVGFTITNPNSVTTTLNSNYSTLFATPFVNEYVLLTDAITNNQALAPVSAVTIPSTSSYVLTIANSYVTNLNNSNPWYVQLWDPEVIPQSKVITTLAATNPRETLYYVNLLRGNRNGVYFPGKNEAISPSNNISLNRVDNTILQSTVSTTLAPTNPRERLYYANLVKGKYGFTIPTFNPADIPRADVNFDVTPMTNLASNYWTYFNNRNKIAVGQPSGKLVNYSTVSTKTTSGSNTLLTINNPTSGINYITSGQTYYGTFNGSTQTLTITSSNTFASHASDFTVEAWIRPTAANNSYIFSMVLNSTVQTSMTATWYLTTGGFLNWYDNITGLYLTSTRAVPLNLWSHVAVVRENNTVKFYINGQLSGTATYPTVIIATFAVYIGSNVGTATTFFAGDISNFRMVKTSVYKGDFIPLGPLGTKQIARPNVIELSGNETSLLALQSAAVTTDNSINNLTIVNTGSISSPTLSNSIGSNAIGTPPQANEYALITDTVTNNQALAQINGSQTSGGGTTTIVTGTYSGEFGGTTQYLYVPSNTALEFGTGNYTLEFWVYLTSISGIACFYNTGFNNFFFQYNPGTGLQTGLTGITANTTFAYTLSTNNWYHIAVSRASNTTRCFVNGSQAGLGQTENSNYGQSGATIGQYGGGAQLVYGNISNLRVVKGVAVYTSAFTPSTTTLTSTQSANVNGNPSATITGSQTSLLTLQNATIIDNSGINTITNNGVTTTSSVVPNLTTSQQIATGSSSYIISLPTSSLSNLNSSNTWAFSLWDPVIFPQNNVLTNTVPQTARERLYYATLAKGRYGLKYPYDQTASLANNVLVGKMRAVNVLKNPSPNDAIYYDAFNLQKQIQALKSPTQVPTNYRLSDFNAPYTYFNNTNKVAVGTYSSRLYNYSTISSKTTVGSNTALTVSNPSSGISFITNSQTYYASFNGSTPQLLQGSQSIGVITTGPFTIEAWVYPTTYSGSPFIVENTYWNAGNNGGWYLTINTNGTLGLGYSTATFNAYSSVNSTISVQTNVWSHIAVVRDINNFISFYINGQLANSPTLLSQSLNLDSVGVQTNYNTRIGAHIADSAVSNAFTGNISNVRIVPNRAVYTGPFVPLGPLSRTQISRQNVLALAGAETSLLALTTSTVTSDSSINNYTLTNNGAMTATLSQTLGTVPVANDFALITDTVTGNQALAQINSVSSNIISGSQLYTTSGASGSLGSASAPSPTGTQYLYTFTAPTGVTSVSVVAIGASGGGGSSNSGGGGGGGLGWKNNITVVPGQSYTVAVGGISSPSQNTIPGGDSYFISTSVVKGGGGTNGTGTSVGANAAGGTFTGDGGGNGGAGGNRQSSSGGGGGGGGYNGDGGAGANGTTGTIGAAGATNSGAGGGGSGADTGLLAGGFGGGVGVFGYTGVTGGTTSGISVAGAPGSGGVGSTYGGGAGGGPSGLFNNGVGGAVRIVWGPGRNFPSTNVSAETFISYSITVPTASLSNLNSSNTWTYSLWDPEVFSQQNVLTNLAPANARERLYYASLVKGKYGQSYPYYPWYALSNNVQLNKLADFNQQYWALSDNANKVAVGTANPRYTTVVRSSSVIISGQNTTINATSGANPQVANFRGTGNGTVGGSTYGYIQFTPAVTISWLNSFCIEFYVYFNTLPAGGYNILSTGSGDINENIFYITPTSMGITSPGYWNVPSPATYSFGTGVWYHIAIMGAPNWTYFAVDGAVSSVNVAAGAGNGYSTTNNWYPNNFNFGGYTPITAGSVPMDHYVANFRITTGSTVYNTTGFARPTTIPTAITGTQILTMTTGLTDLSGQSRTITLTTQNGTTGNRPFMSSSPVNTPFVTVPAAYYYPNDQLLLTDTVTNNQALVTVTSCDFVSTVVVPTSQISNLNTANSWNMQLWSSDLFPQANVKTTLSPSTARERLYYAALAKGRYGLRYPYESPATLPDSLTLDNLRLYKTPNNGFITTSVDNTTPLAIINQIDWYSPANSKDAIAGSASTRQNITGQVLGINVGETTSTISFKSNAVWNYYPRANDYVLLTNDRTGVQSIAKILTISNNAGFNIVVPLGQALVAGDGTFTGTGVAITGSSANTYNFSWTCPDNIFSVSAVAVGAGGGGSSAYNNRGAGGGALAWSNGISVVPGQTYSITVGTGPVNTPGVTSTVTLGSVTLTAGGGGGPSGPGGTYSVTGTSGTSNTFGGGNGGSGSTGGNAGGGGGGAGGYGGAGGAGGNGLYDTQSGTPGDPGQPGTGGGGGGGGGSGTYGSGYGGGGGGVGLLGIGANGVGGARGPANGGPGGGGGGSGGTGFNVPTGGSYGGGGGGYGGGGGPGAVRIIWPALRIADGSTLRAFGNGTNIENALSTDQSSSIQESLLIFTATVATSEIQNIIDAPTCTIQPWDPSYIPQALVTTLFPPINPRERLYWTNLTSKYSSLTGVTANKDTTEVVYDRDTKGIVVKFRTAALGQGVQDPAYKSVAPIQFWN